MYKEALSFVHLAATVLKFAVLVNAINKNRGLHRDQHPLRPQGFRLRERGQNPHDRLQLRRLGISVDLRLHDLHCRMIVSGAVAERMHSIAHMVYSIVLTSLIYPIVVYWARAGGWASAGVVAEDLLFGCRVLDFAGLGVVHGLGGPAALCACPVVGRFNADGTFNTLPQQYAMLQVLFVFFSGWSPFCLCSVRRKCDIFCGFMGFTCVALAFFASRVVCAWWVGRFLCYTGETLLFCSVSDCCFLVGANEPRPFWLAAAVTSTRPRSSILHRVPFIRVKTWQQLSSLRVTLFEVVSTACSVPGAVAALFIVYMEVYLKCSLES